MPGILGPIPAGDLGRSAWPDRNEIALPGNAKRYPGNERRDRARRDGTDRSVSRTAVVPPPVSRLSGSAGVLIPVPGSTYRTLRVPGPVPPPGTVRKTSCVPGEASCRDRPGVPRRTLRLREHRSVDGRPPLGQEPDRSRVHRDPRHARIHAPDPGENVCVRRGARIRGRPVPGFRPLAGREREGFVRLVHPVHRAVPGYVDDPPALAGAVRTPRPLGAYSAASRERTLCSPAVGSRLNSAPGSGSPGSRRGRLSRPGPERFTKPPPSSFRHPARSGGSAPGNGSECILDGYGFRCSSGRTRSRPRRRTSPGHPLPGWINGPVLSAQRLPPPSRTVQIRPIPVVHGIRGYPAICTPRMQECHLATIPGSRPPGFQHGVPAPVRLDGHPF